MTNSNLVPIPELFVSAQAAAALKIEAGTMPSWDLTPRQTCDLELLMNGGFHPLQGFHTEADYDGVVENMRMADGTLWPIPITLDVSEKFAATVAKAILFPQSVEALGENGHNLSSEVWWSANHPFKSSLTGKTGRELADQWENGNRASIDAALGL